MASPAVAHAPATYIDIQQLRLFHQTHFAGQDVPAVSSMSHAEDPSHENDGLGYYDDGIKRTLTDEQVRMFRHSEIQRLLSERKQAQAQEKEDQRRQRRQQKKTTRTHRFADEPLQRQHNIDMLTYDDVPSMEQDQPPLAEKKFLWPVLGS